MKMICPISPIRPQTGKHHDCSGEKCAWFDPKNKVCAVLTVGRAALVVAGRMDDMLECGLPIIDG